MRQRDHGNREQYLRALEHEPRHRRVGKQRIVQLGQDGARHDDGPHPGQSYEELAQRLKLESESVVRRVVELLRDKHQLTFETVVRTGDARDVIIDEASSWGGGPNRRGVARAE